MPSLTKMWLLVVSGVACSERLRYRAICDVQLLIHRRLTSDVNANRYKGWLQRRPKKNFQHALHWSVSSLSPCAGDSIHAIPDGFLKFIDRVLRLTHGFSSMVMPLGIGGRPPCVPALFLAIMVRLVVSTVFLGVRILLSLPVRFAFIFDSVHASFARCSLASEFSRHYLLLIWSRVSHRYRGLGTWMSSHDGLVEV